MSQWDCILCSVDVDLWTFGMFCCFAHTRTQGYIYRCMCHDVSTFSLVSQGDSQEFLVVRVLVEGELCDRRSFADSVKP